MVNEWSWRKSSRSATNGECVEVGARFDGRVIGVRDSKLGEESPVLRFAPGAFAAFLNSQRG